MTFLAPAAGLIAAAIAVPILIVFYLLKLRRRPVRVSSTLLWERTTHDLQVNTPLRWLRPSWLLLVQLLALLAFLGALARPALDAGGPDADRIVIVIDRSAPMSAADGLDLASGERRGVTRLDEAKARAEALVDRLRRAGGGRRAEAMVVSFAAAADTAAPLTSSTTILRDAVRSIDASDQPANPESLARLIRALATTTGEEEPTESGESERTAVYIFSDGAFAADPAARIPGGPGLSVELVRVGPAPLPPPAPPRATDPAAPTSAVAAGRDNVGIVAISARRDYDDPAIARIFARVQSALADPVSITLTLRVEGELIEAKPLTIPGISRDATGETTLGETATTFELNQTTGGLAIITIDRDDLLAADNSAALVLSPPQRPAVLVVGPGVPEGGEGGAAAALQGADPFLLSVLQELDLRRLSIVDPSMYQTMAATDPALGGRIRTAPASGARDETPGWDLVIFDRVRPATTPAIASLSIGAGLPIPGLSVTPVEAPADAEIPATRFLAWRRTHPLMRDVGLDPIVVAPPMRISVPTTGADDSTRDLTTTILAQGADGPLLVLLEQAGIRRIVIGFDLARSNWGPDVSFPVFMVNAIEYLTLRGQSEAGRAYTTIQPVTVAIAPGSQRITATGPRTITAQPSSPGAAAVSLGILDRAGIYRVEGAAASDRAIAVNLVNAAASRIDTADWGGAASADGQRSGQSANGAADAAAGPREIWHWFVLAGLLLAMVEWALYAWRMRT